MNIRAKYFSVMLGAILQRLRIIKYRALSPAQHVSGGAVLHQPVLFSGLGEILLGRNVQFGIQNSPFFYNGYGYVEARFAGSRIVVGDGVRFNNNCTLISAVSSITIGARCLIGFGVEILDSDFHGISSAQRSGVFAKSGEVSIGRDVFIGSNVKILKGVSIGDGSVIGNGSVVTRSIPAGVVACGVPCRVIGSSEGGVTGLPESVFIHPLANVESKFIGAKTRVWPYSHILPNAVLGEDCNICERTFIENDVVIGDRVTIKCGVSLWDGIRIEDDVFVGPDVSFSNDKFPRSKQYPERFLAIRIKRGASIGANATLLPGVTIGENAMVGAGSVVTHDVPANAIVVGNPAKIIRQLG